MRDTDLMQLALGLVPPWMVQLRMENVVVLTAAGCSISSGGRLMAGPADNNLECLVLDAVDHCPLSDEARAIIKWKKDNDLPPRCSEWVTAV